MDVVVVECETDAVGGGARKPRSCLNVERLAADATWGRYTLRVSVHFGEVNDVSNRFNKNKMAGGVERDEYSVWYSWGTVKERN